METTTIIIFVLLFAPIAKVESTIALIWLSKKVKNRAIDNTGQKKERCHPIRNCTLETLWNVMPMWSNTKYHAIDVH